MTASFKLLFDHYQLFPVLYRLQAAGFRLQVKDKRQRPKKIKTERMMKRKYRISNNECRISKLKEKRVNLLTR
jgi:hypothetical protein